MSRIIFTLIGSLLYLSAYAQMECIRTKIDKIILGKKITPGLMLYDFETNDTLSINSDKYFPMQSVYKFPIALALLNQVDLGKYSLNDSVYIPKSSLKSGMWSPIREKYPNGNIYMPLSEIIEYTVALSDNNGSDILMKMAGGPEAVDKYIKQTGIRNTDIKNYECELQTDWAIQYQNRTTPKAMIELLKRFKNNSPLDSITHNFLWNIMRNTNTGSFKNKIPETLIVIHKTGNSGFNKRGVSAATNDVGIFFPNDHSCVAFSIFIGESTEDNETNYEIISDIAKAIYDCYTSPDLKKFSEIRELKGNERRSAGLHGM